MRLQHIFNLDMCTLHSVCFYLVTAIATSVCPHLLRFRCAPEIWQHLCGSRQ